LFALLRERRDGDHQQQEKKESEAPRTKMFDVFSHCELIITGLISLLVSTEYEGCHAERCKGPALPADYDCRLPTDIIFFCLPAFLPQHVGA
jgi:hypothetical protein